jgi:hypothetical protein
MAQSTQALVNNLVETLNKVLIDYAGLLEKAAEIQDAKAVFQATEIFTEGLQTISDILEALQNQQDDVISKQEMLYLLQSM